MTPTGGYDTHVWRGSAERLFTVGEDRDLLILPALFAEANRTRAFTVAVMRTLAGRGLRCVLPDLPGTLESRATLAKVSWQDWCAFVLDLEATLDRPLVLAIRGGALLPTATPKRLHFAPTSGERLLRDLLRARLASDKEARRATTMAALTAGLAYGTERLAGFDLAPALSQPLAAAEAPPEAHTVRLTSDAAEADARIDGPALWRRAEPGTDAPLAHALADQATAWSDRCAAG